ncbi:MAG: MoaD/ThiS family protein [Planctomycetaceae bacterium]|nr:MoaD/ThiS family protein [Planctomycetaceae bacterium]
MPLVFIPAQLRDLTGGAAQIEVAGATVRELVATLDHQFPGIAGRLCQEGELSPALQVSIDGTLSRRGLDAKVAGASEVHFLPVFGGG